LEQVVSSRTALLRTAQTEVFCVVMPYSVAVGYQRFRGPLCLHFQSEDGGSMDLWKDDILLQHYTASQHTRHRGNLKSRRKVY